MNSVNNFLIEKLSQPIYNTLYEGQTKYNQNLSIEEIHSRIAEWLEPIDKEEYNTLVNIMIPNKKLTSAEIMNSLKCNSRLLAQQRSSDIYARGQPAIGIQITTKTAEEIQHEKEYARSMVQQQINQETAQQLQQASIIYYLNRTRRS